MMSVRSKTTNAETASDSAITLRSVSSRSEWAHLLSQHTGVTPFHRWEWLEWVAPLLECQFVPLAVTIASHDVGVVPLLLRTRGPVKTANWVPFPYLGPLVGSENLEATLAAVRRYARTERIINLQLSLHPFASQSSTSAVTLTASQFETHSDETYIIDLKDRELADIRQSMSSHTRQRLNRIERSGMILRDATHDEIATLLPAIESAALAHQGLQSPYSDQLGDLLANRPPDMPLHIATADVNGTAVGVLVSIGGPVTVGWIGGILQEHRATNANVALYWDAIAWAHSIGSESLDMVGVPNPGIAEFKRQFGGTLYSYPVGQACPAIYRRLQQAHERYFSHNKTEETAKP